MGVIEIKWKRKWKIKWKLGLLEVCWAKLAMKGLCAKLAMRGVSRACMCVCEISRRSLLQKGAHN